MNDDAALWATDTLLDSLALGDLVGNDDRGLHLLSALVVDVSTDLPTTSPVRDDLRARRSSLRRLAPRTGVALAAIVAVVSTGGVAAASVNAGPTSALFPLHQVLTGQPQLDGSQRQALEVRDKLQSATKALAAGKVARAQKDVTAAAGRIAKVAEVDGRRDLTAQWVMVNKQVKARAVAPVLVPVKPTHAPVPAHTPLPTPDPKPTATPSPTLSHSPSSTPTVAPAPTTTAPVPTSGVPTSVTPTPVAPTTPQPSATLPVAPVPSDAAPTVTDTTPSPSDSPTKGGHHGKGGKTTPTPTAAQGSPVDPIVITPDPTVTLSAVPGTQTAPAASQAPAPSAPAPSASPTAVGVVPPPSTLPLP